MLDEERRTDATNTGGMDRAGSDMARMLDENRGLATGTIVASALAAAVIVYMLRRQREEEERKPATRAGMALDRARDLIGDERIEASRDFMVERLLPEFKPVMLAILKDLREVTDDWFKQAEKAIKKM
jgi:hypothetical protein